MSDDRVLENEKDLSTFSDLVMWLLRFTDKKSGFFLIFYINLYDDG